MNRKYNFQLGSEILSLSATDRRTHRRPPQQFVSPPLAPLNMLTLSRLHGALGVSLEGQVRPIGPTRSLLRHGQPASNFRQLFSRQMAYSATTSRAKDSASLSVILFTCVRLPIADRTAFQEPSTPIRPQLADKVLSPSLNKRRRHFSTRNRPWCRPRLQLRT
jgi:hypothetical protein